MTTKKPFVGNFWIDDAWRAGLVTSIGTKWMTVVYMDSPVRIVRLPVSERPRPIGSTEYPVGRAARKFRSAGKRLGITKSAKSALRGL